MPLATQTGLNRTLTFIYRNLFDEGLKFQMYVLPFVVNYRVFTETQTAFHANTLSFHMHILSKNELISANVEFTLRRSLHLQIFTHSAIIYTCGMMLILV